MRQRNADVGSRGDNLTLEREYAGMNVFGVLSGNSVGDDGEKRRWS